MGLVKVARTDPNETWLVRQLLAAEPDLHRYADQPMIFPVYGRGRTMPPLVGKGITAENLRGGVSYLLGACSCLVKEQNPGVDLVFRWDWNAAADAMAMKDDPSLDGQLNYREFIPGEVSTQPPGARREPLPGNAGSAGQASAVAASEVPKPQNTPAPARRANPPPDTSFAPRQTWLLGIGVATVGLVVLLAGFFVVRRR